MAIKPINSITITTIVIIKFKFIVYKTAIQEPKIKCEIYNAIKLK